jgi:hypothetical protein
MATTLKLRRGTTSQHSSFTGAQGEITFDTDKDTAVVHDGSTAGGFELARADYSNVSTGFLTQSNIPDHVAMGNFVNFGYEVTNQVDIAVVSSPQTRPLNITHKHDTTNQTWFSGIFGNGFDLDAGKYFISAYFQTGESGHTKIIMEGDGSFVFQTHPMTSFSSSSQVETKLLWMQGYFTLSSENLCTFIQRSSTTGGDSYMGYSAAFQGGYNERYTDVCIWRIGS